jgi:hypothetical protein
VPDGCPLDAVADVAAGADVVAGRSMAAKPSPGAPWAVAVVVPVAVVVTPAVGAFAGGTVAACGCCAPDGAPGSTFAALPAFDAFAEPAVPADAPACLASLPSAAPGAGSPVGAAAGVSSPARARSAPVSACPSAGEVDALDREAAASTGPTVELGALATGEDPAADALDAPPASTAVASAPASEVPAPDAGGPLLIELCDGCWAPAAEAV